MVHIVTGELNSKDLGVGLWVMVRLPLIPQLQMWRYNLLMPILTQGQNLYVADIPDFNGRPVDFRQLWRNREKAIRARDVVDFEQMHRILTYDKNNQVLWIPKVAVASLLQEDQVKQGCEYVEMVLHEMWCTSNLRIKSLTPQGDSVAVRFHDPEAKIQFEHPFKTFN